MLHVLYSAAETITLAADQTASAPPSLFWTIIASAFGGALITSGVTIWAKLADTSAERRKWLRNEKLTTYTEFSRVSEHVYYSVGQKLSSEAWANFLQDMLSVMARIELIASPEINEQCKKVRKSASAKQGTSEWEEYRDHAKELLKLMRSDLLSAKKMKY